MNPGIVLKETTRGWFISGSFHFTFPAGLALASILVEANAGERRVRLQPDGVGLFVWGGVPPGFNWKPLGGGPKKRHTHTLLF